MQKLGSWLSSLQKKELQLEENGKEDCQELATMHYQVIVVAGQKLHAQKHE